MAAVIIMLVLTAAVLLLGSAALLNHLGIAVSILLLSIGFVLARMYLTAFSYWDAVGYGAAGLAGLAAALYLGVRAYRSPKNSRRDAEVQKLLKERDRLRKRGAPEGDPQVLAVDARLRELGHGPSDIFAKLVR